ncbi:MAG: heme peroxidase family protein [Candidatus Binatia bacterium]
MFTRVSHAEGVKQEEEILFSTPFGYMFPEAAKSRLCLLPQTETTLSGLRALGAAMADTGAPNDPQNSLDSNIPALFTYLGQFIDHDLTARTDRDGSVSSLGKGEPITPIDPDHVARVLRNGRRPQFDLDSVFGDGPGFTSVSQSQILYDSDLALNVFAQDNITDLTREPNTFKAIIADMRNDENINISQLHAACLRFYNAVHDAQSGNKYAKYSRARQLTRWAYQYVVVHDYLMRVCDERIVQDTLANGPWFYGPTAGHGDAFMPVEFSVAAFRFGHSMIRPFYKLNNTTTRTILQILGVSGDPNNFDANGQLKEALVIDFKNFIGSTAQKARKIDTRIAQGLFTLPFRPDDPVLTNLARSNLFRGYNLSIPTGQAICDAMGMHPLTATEILTGEEANIAAIVKDAYFDHRTPLWYYILREAAVQHGGAHLGDVGSRIVAETFIGILKQDPNSYLNNVQDSAVKSTGIDVKPGAGGLINTITDFLKFAGYSGI